MAKGRAVPNQRDIEKMHEDDLGRYNALLGERQDAQTPEVRAARIALNKELSRRAAERAEQVYREEREGKRPPGHHITL